MHPAIRSLVLAALAVASSLSTLDAQVPGARPRARDLGITFGGEPGRWNAITDVPGVVIGYVTLIRGEGPLVRGKGPVRTGVTAILPRGRRTGEPVFAAVHALNGNGELTGYHWIRESGFLYGPVLITNTHSVGAVHEGAIAWAADGNENLEFSLPVVAETYDGYLNDVDGFHVKPAHAIRALESAASGPVAEGNVGGGTGMICHGFKGGTGTASRRLPASEGGYTVGVLVQCNYGQKRLFTVEGVPVGPELADVRACRVGREPVETTRIRLRPCTTTGASADAAADPELSVDGSIIVVVATDAPLLPTQLDRIARRVPLAVGRMGGLGEDSSGDIFLAFSTQRVAAPADSAVARVGTLANERMNPLFEATVQATQEAILNALLAAETMTGANGIRIPALPADRLVAAMRKHGRLQGR